MPNESNEKIVRAFLESFEGWDLDRAVGYLAPELVVHWSGGPDLHGPEAWRGIASAFAAAFPDLSFDVNVGVEGGDLVALRWTWRATHKADFMGVPASGKRVEVTGMGIYRISGRKIAEEWVMEDMLTLLQQLGAIPAPA